MKKHKLLILIGCVLSILTFVLDWKNIYPLTIWFFYSSIPVMIIGIILWIIDYRNKTGHFPNLSKLYIKKRKEHSGKFGTHSTVLSLLFDNVLLFWALIIFAVMLFTNIFDYSYKKSEVFLTAKKNLESNVDIESSIGKIKYYGIVPAVRHFNSEMTQNKNAEINTKLVGEIGTVKVKIKLKYDLDWKVDTVLFN